MNIWLTVLFIVKKKKSKKKFEQLKNFRPSFSAKIPPKFWSGNVPPFLDFVRKRHQLRFNNWEWQLLNRRWCPTVYEHWSGNIPPFLDLVKKKFKKKFPVRELNPGLSGESRVSWPPRLTGRQIELTTPTSLGQTESVGTSQCLLTTKKIFFSLPVKLVQSWTIGGPINDRT